MHLRKACGFALLCTGLLTVTLQAQLPAESRTLPPEPDEPSPIRQAQFPSIPGMPAPPSIPGQPTLPGTTGLPGSSVLNPQSNLWSWMCPTDAQLKRWQKMFCGSGFGKMFSAMSMPVSMFTGGLFGSCCPTTPFGGLGPGTQGGPADKIAQDEAGAKARRADMRYLGTVDCHYWPEAEAGLIGGLRTDKNECVRWEAAISLGKGCCCTKKTIEALRLTVIGSEKDGNPSETSDRVKAAAFYALNHCLCCYRAKAPDTPKEQPVVLQKSVQQLLPAYYVQLENAPAEPILKEAQLLTEQIRTGQVGPLATMTTGTRSVSHILARAGDPKLLPRPGQPAPAAGPGAPLKPVATAPPPPPIPVNRDLVTWFRYRMYRDRAAEHVPVEPPIEPAPVIMPQVEPAVPLTPATGQRDLFNILRNSTAEPR